MAYTPQTWANSPSTTTPLSAARLGVIESGIQATAVVADAAYKPGGTDVAIADGGTGASTLPSGLLKGAGTGAITAATAGTDYQAPDADLTAIAALTSAANQLPYATGTNVWAMTTLSAFARTLIDDADAAAMRGTLGAAAAAATINPQTGTTYTLALTDADNVITASNAAAQTYTFPQNSAVAIPVGASGEIHVIGAGQVTCVNGTGATITGRGGALKSAGQYAVIGWRKLSTNGFNIYGDTTT